MKYIKRIVIVVLVLVIIAMAFQYPKLNIISGYAAKNMASTVFIAERSAQSVNDQDHQVPMIKLAETEVNADERSATASVFGLMERTAVYRDGLGSVLVPDGDQLPANLKRPNRRVESIALPFPFGHLTAKDTMLE